MKRLLLVGWLVAMLGTFGCSSNDPTGCLADAECGSGQTCLDGACIGYVGPDEDVQVSDALVLAEYDPNYESVVVETDRLIFNGRGPAADFDYKVGDILSSTHNYPGYIRRVEAIEYRDDKLIAHTTDVALFDVVSGKFTRHVTFGEGGEYTVIDGEGNPVPQQLPVPSEGLTMLRQPLAFDIGPEVDAGSINLEEGGKLRFEGLKFALKATKTCTGNNCEGGKCNDQGDCKTGFTCEDDPDPDDAKMDGTCKYSLTSLEAEIAMTLNGYVQFKPDFHVSADTGWFSLKEFEFWIQGMFDLNLEDIIFTASVKYSVSHEWLLGSYAIPFTIMVGWFPVPMAIKFKFHAGFNAAIEAVGEAKTGARLWSQLRYGAHYEKSAGWNMIAERSYQTSTKPWEYNLTGKITAKAYLKPGVQLEVARGSGIGPELGFEPSANLEFTFLPERCLRIWLAYVTEIIFRSGVFENLGLDDWGPTALHEPLTWDLYNNCKEKVCRKDKEPAYGTEEVWFWDKSTSEFVPAEQHGLYVKCEMLDPPNECCAGECVEFCGTGNLEGLVVDMDTDDPIPGAHVRVTASGGAVEFEGDTPANGVYQVNDLEAGVYGLYITAPGYYDYSSSFRIRTDETTYVSKLRAIPADCDMDGTISGVVTDATTGEVLANATIKVIKTSNDALVWTGTSAADGTYKTDPIPVDYYYIEATAEGYLKKTLQNISVCGRDDGDDTNDDVVENITLAPWEPGHFHVVLQWGDQPKDLDLHADLPDGTHVFYRMGCRGDRDDPPYAGLDVDVREGYGPETITVTQYQTGGTYKFYVHNYGAQNDEDDSGSLAQSGAFVEVTDGNGDTIREFNVPGSCGAYFWYIFEVEFDAEGNVLNLTPLNNCGGGANPDDYDPPACTP